jgi:hypothetical protein
LAYEPNLTFVPSLVCESSSVCVSSSIPIMVSSSSYDESEDENKPLSSHLPPNESIKHESTPTPQLPIFVCSTHEAASDLVGDPSYRRQTCS